jgi:hypothetical protein
MNQFNGSLADLNSFSVTYKPAINPLTTLPSLEERIATLETVLSNLEPAITDGFTKLEGRISNLEKGTQSGGTGNSSSVYEQRFSTIEQQIVAFSQQNTAIGQQITNIHQQVTSIRQQIASTQGIDPTVLANMEKRITTIEQRMDSAVQGSGGQTTPPSNGTYALCNVRGLNVRKGASSNFPVIAGISFGQRVKVLDRQDGWAKLENPSGWCAEVYLSFI